MNDLDQLRQRLNKVLLTRPLTGLTANDATLLARLTASRQTFSPPRGHRALPRVAQGVMAFRLHGRETPYPDLKYACFGVARPTDWDGRLLLDDGQLVDALLAAVAQRAGRQPKIFAACLRGLAHAWTADIANADASLGRSAQQNSRKIADFLATHNASRRPDA
jgi:hypothetical protein